MSSILSDPIDGRPYHELPWDRLPVDTSLVGELRRIADLASFTHYQVVDDAKGPGPLGARLDRLAAAVATHYSGLDAADADRFARGWRTLLADLVLAGPDAAETWLRVQEESITGRWPRQARWRVLALANAVVRSPEVESLHATGRPRTTFLDNDVGTMVLCWAAGSVLADVDIRGALASPQACGLTDDDLDRAFAFAGVAAARELPGWMPLARLRACAEDRITFVAADPDAPAGPAGHGPSWDNTPRRDTVRHAWTAPADDELLWDEADVLRMPTLTRLSRHPYHLATTVGRWLGTGKQVVTPNVLLAPEGTGRRRQLLPAPSVTDNTPAQQGSQRAWHDPAGLASLHAVALGLGSTVAQLVGRNDPCPCGSGRKAKRCCQR